MHFCILKLLCYNFLAEATLAAKISRLETPPAEQCPKEKTSFVETVLQQHVSGLITADLA